MHQEAKNHPQHSSFPEMRNALLAGVRLALTIGVVTLLSHFPQANAQTDLANIVGTVTDSTGAAVPNCQVEIKNTDTSAIRNVTTDANGFYSAPSLTVGSYAITAAAPNFKKSTQTAVLTLGGLTANFRLTVGSISEQVTVNGGAGSTALQTDSHDVSVSLSSTQLVNLPNNGRSILTIATLGPASQPGTDSGVDSGDESFYGQLGSAVIIAGLQNSHTLFLQDGVDNTNLLTQTANILASVEATQEVTTLLNGAPARFSQPAVINVITKSGSNQFHGTAYDFLQNDAANAINWFAITKPAERYNQFGANLGGPILKNRLFGFFDYSGLRSDTGDVVSDRVPTAAERTGNFSADPEVIYNPATYNPATGASAPFPGNQIPAIGAFAQLWLQNYPQANTPLGANNINYVANLPSIDDYDEYLGRVDWNISDRDQLFGTVARLSNNVGSDSITPGLFGIFDALKGTNVSIEDTFVLNKNTVNVAKFGYNRSNLFRTQQGEGLKDYASSYGLANVKPLPQQWNPPSITLANYTSLGDPYSPQGAIQNRYQVADEIDWKRGNHTISFGGEYVRVQFDGDWVVGNNGIYSFDGTATSQYVDGVRSSTNEGNALADLELGFPITANALTGTSLGLFLGTDVSGYIQDDWKASSRLTLNLGIRYDFDNPPNTKIGALYNLTSNSNSPGTWNTNYNDWGPRIGFAYNGPGNTVFRGGYGIFYAPILYNNLQFEVLYSPNVVNQTYTLSIADPVNIQNLFLANAPSVPGQGGYTIAKTLKDTSAQEWNLNVEHTLGASTLLTLAYIGDVTRHQSARADFNQPDALSPGSTSGKLNVRPQPLAGQIDGQLNTYGANYNGLTVKAERRFSNGLQFLGSYTWSKALDLLDGDNADIQNIYQPQLTYGPAGYDRTNNILISGLYQLPFGPGKRFATSSNIFNREIVGGWELTGIQQVATGQPISITANNNADTSSLHSVYALKVCDPSRGFVHSERMFYNPACFVQPGAGQYGSARSGPRQPHLVNTNLGLEKTFPITERQSLQFRAEAFDVFNHPTLGTGSTLVSAPNAGLVTEQTSGSNGPRVMQFALRYAF
jgi:hypothetical protein